MFQIILDIPVPQALLMGARIPDFSGSWFKHIHFRVV